MWHESNTFPQYFGIGLAQYGYANVYQIIKYPFHSLQFYSNICIGLAQNGYLLVPMFFSGVGLAQYGYANVYLPKLPVEHKHRNTLAMMKSL